MTAPALTPSATVVEATPSAGAAMLAPGATPTVSLFPLLLGDLLQPDDAENPPMEEKPEGSCPDANWAAIVSVQVPAPPPALGPIAGQTGGAACGASDLLFAPAVDADEAGASPDWKSGIAAAPWPPRDAPASIDAPQTRILPIVIAPAPGISAPALPDVRPERELSELSVIDGSQSQPPDSPSDAPPAAASPATRLNVVPNPWTSAAPPDPARISADPSLLAPGPAPLEQAPRVAERTLPPVEPADIRIQPEGRVELAFTARLSPVEREVAPHPVPAVPARFHSRPPEGPVPALQPAETNADSARGDAPAAPSLAPRVAAHPPVDSAPARPDPDRPPNLASQGLASAARAPEAPVPAARLSAVGPPRPAAAAPSEPASSVSAPARDIRLQVNGGEQRVDVRLTERGGEVQVAVRTADSGLTEALRGDLPALAARLEQTGFRAETWHPGATRTEHYGFTPESASSGSPPQGQGGERHGNPHDQQPPPRRAPLSEDRSDSPPPEFSWLLSSLR